MDFLEWEPYYERILEDFGFVRSEDESVARELDRLLGGMRTHDRALREALEGREVTVVGNGPDVAKEIDAARGVLVTADEATSVALARGLLPAILERHAGTRTRQPAHRLRHQHLARRRERRDSRRDVHRASVDVPLLPDHVPGVDSEV